MADLSKSMQKALSNPEAIPDRKPTRQSRLASLRKTALFLLLAVMLVALAYDYGVARPAVNDAYEKIAIASTESNSIGDAVFTNIDVQTLLAMEPCETFADGPETVEVFEFPAGIPGRPHKLWAVYKNHGDQKMFFRIAKFAYEASHEVATISRTTKNLYTKEEARMLYTTEAEELARFGDGNYDEAIAAADKRTSSRQTSSGGPETMVPQSLSPVALSPAADDSPLGETPSNTIGADSTFDTNGDGVISKDELEAKIEKQRQRFANEVGKSVED